MDLNEIAVFIRVVQAGSFTRAARALEMPNSTVSARVASLEARLGVTLIQRTTRRLNVTAAGRTYYQRCLEALGQIEVAEAEVVVAQTEPSGLLRITAPVDLGATILPKVISAYTERFKKTRVEVLLTDRRVDLLTEQMDLAIRAGDMSDSTLIAKKLGIVRFALFASPSYLKRRALPTHPRDLTGHSFLEFTNFRGGGWTLRRAGTSTTVPIEGRIRINDLNLIKLMTIEGAGIALLPHFFCAEEERRGRITRVLPDWVANEDPIHFVYAAQRYVSPKISAFIELSAEAIRGGLALKPGKS